MRGATPSRGLALPCWSGCFAFLREYFGLSGRDGFQLSACAEMATLPQNTALTPASNRAKLIVALFPAYPA